MLDASLEFEGDTQGLRALLGWHVSAEHRARRGAKAGLRAYLEALCRTSSGEFTEDQAQTLDQLGVLAEADTFDQAIVPASHLLPQFPNATVDALTVTQIRQGKDFRLSCLSIELLRIVASPDGNTHSVLRKAIKSFFS